MKKIMLSLMTVAVVAGAAIWGTSAFFSDTETSTGNTFTAGSVDLKVSSHYTDYTGDQMGFETTDLNGEALFSFADMKPGDMGGGRFDVVATTNPYWACMKTTIDTTPENEVIEPETGDTTPNIGELQNFMSFYFWNDLNADGEYTPSNIASDRNLVGPLTLTQVETMGYLPLGDATGVPGPSFFSGEPLVPGQEYNLGYKYCFGTWGDDPMTNGLSCTGEGDQNIAQTDGVTGSIEFYAVQSRNNTEFTCQSMNPVFELTDPSDANNVNQTLPLNDLPYFTYVINGLNIDLVLVNPTGHTVWFDYIVDGEPGYFSAGTSNILISQGPLTGETIGNLYHPTSVPAHSTKNITLTGTTTIKVGMRFGPEQHDYLDWATFTAQ